jgi:hypothetical protein
MDSSGIPASSFLAVGRALARLEVVDDQESTAPRNLSKSILVQAANKLQSFWRKANPLKSKLGLA